MLPTSRFAFILLIGLSFTALSLSAQRNPRKVEQEWKTDKSNYRVDSLNEFLTLLPRDGILPIDAPEFWNKNESDAHYFPHEPVIALEFDGIARAYPLSILMFHEIVNDKIGDRPVSITYCPLCNAAIAFDRKLILNDKEFLLDFGTSGMLRNSDLVMWDRQTETWWQQFTGEGLVGNLAGVQLDILPSFQISYQDFFDRFPEGQVLSTATGADEETMEMYGTNPYTTYDSIGKKPFLFKGKIDKRLPAMERVVNIRVNGKDKIYPWSILSKKRVVNDQFEGESVVLFHAENTRSVLDSKAIETGRKIGSVTVFIPEVEGQTLTFKEKRGDFIDKETKSKWDITGRCYEGKWKGKSLVPMYYGNHFAFAWFAFHSDAEIYQK